MKKYLIITTIIAALFFSACNPNEELYKEHDEAIDNAYSEDIEYVLTSSDYQAASNFAMEDAVTEEDSTYAGYIKTFESFNSHYTASDYVPAVLSENFAALNNNSTAQITYNNYNEDFNFEENYFGDIESITLTNANYAELGFTNCFTEGTNVANILPDFITNQNLETDIIYAKVTYLYPDVNTKVADFYIYDGTSWSKADDSYIVVTEADYAAMGNPGPGSHNNFSDDYPAENYLPALLNNKYPYAQASDFKFVIYDYYSGSASTFGRKMVYNSSWEFYSPAEAITSQFVHIGTGWIFDPTVMFTISADDYQIIVDYVGANIGSEYVSSYGNNEYYTGASAYYGNFDIRVSKRRSEVPQDFPESMSDEDALALVWERLNEGLDILLKEKYPDAVPKVGDFDVYYILTFDTFDDNYAHTFYTATYKCTASGSPATFEQIEMKVAE